MKKNSTIKWIEEEYGMPINEVLRHLYLEEKLTVGDLADRLLITRSIAYRWLKHFGIELRTNKVKYLKGKKG